MREPSGYAIPSGLQYWHAPKPFNPKEIKRPRRDLNPCRRRERPVSWARLDDGDVILEGVVGGSEAARQPVSGYVKCAGESRYVCFPALAATAFCPLRDPLSPASYLLDTDTA
jgi:hypothetical protein